MPWPTKPTYPTQSTGNSMTDIGFNLADFGIELPEIEVIIAAIAIILVIVLAVTILVSILIIRAVCKYQAKKNAEAFKKLYYELTASNNQNETENKDDSSGAPEQEPSIVE